jgi:hypothetical protein
MTEVGTPLISTIIPTYRRPALLKRAITSALQQHEISLCVRVLDNASGDETGDMVSEMAEVDQRLQYHRHEQNIGAAANFEFGLRSVDTPFFSLLSDDDYLLPGFYEQAVSDLDKHPEAMFWAGLTLNADEQGRIWDARVDRWPREGLFNPPDGLLTMMHGLAPTWTGILFRREILDRIGLPDQETLGPSDLDYTLRAAASQPFVLRKYPSAVFTLNAASFSSTEPMSSFWPGWQKMFRNLEAQDGLDAHAKAAALVALHQDAQRMLFRRGVNALASARYDFAREAAAALQANYGDRARAGLLIAVAAVCDKVPGLQRAYTGAYRLAERRLVKSRAGLTQRFGHLIR